MIGVCPNHGQVAGVRADFNWALFIVLSCCFGIGLIYILIYFLSENEDKCPQCKLPLVPVTSSPQGYSPMPIGQNPYPGPNTYYGTLQQPQQPQWTQPAQTPQTQAPEAMFCPKCGASIPPQSRFCLTCGEKIRE
jgi:hypothetical protein